MKKRLLGLILALVLITMVPLSARAAEKRPDAEVESDTHFNSYGMSLTHTASGNLYISFNVTARQISAVIGVVSYDIQQKVNGEFVTIESGLQGYLETDDVSCMFAKYYKSAAPGETYRVVAHAYCLKYDGTSKYKNIYSPSYTMPK